MSRLDPDRPYVPGSPIGGERPNVDGFGDQHFWGVWHGSLDWKAYETSGARFSSEYGFASCAGIECWREQGIGDLESQALWWHNKTGKSRETFEEAVELYYPKAKSLAEWVFFSQLNQRDALRCAIEHYRTAKFCRGSLIWQLNDCWPTMSWAVIDGRLEPKLAASELRRLYAPDLLVLRIEGDRAEARWASESGLAVPSEFEWEVWDLMESVCVDRGELPFDRSLDLRRFERNRTVCMVRAGELETWRFLERPKALQCPPPGDIQVEYDGERTTLRCEQLILDLALDGPGLDRLVNLRPRVPVRVHGVIRGARSLFGEHRIELS